MVSATDSSGDVDATVLAGVDLAVSKDLDPRRDDDALVPWDSVADVLYMTRAALDAKSAAARCLQSELEAVKKELAVKQEMFEKVVSEAQEKINHDVEALKEEKQRSDDRDEQLVDQLMLLKDKEEQLKHQNDLYLNQLKSASVESARLRMELEAARAEVSSTAADLSSARAEAVAAASASSLELMAERTNATRARERAAKELAAARDEAARELTAERSAHESTRDALALAQTELCALKHRAEAATAGLARLESRSCRQREKHADALRRVEERHADEIKRLEAEKAEWRLMAEKQTVLVDTLADRAPDDQLRGSIAALTDALRVLLPTANTTSGPPAPVSVASSGAASDRPWRISSPGGASFHTSPFGQRPALRSRSTTPVLAIGRTSLDLKDGSRSTSMLGRRTGSDDEILAREPVVVMEASASAPGSESPSPRRVSQISEPSEADADADLPTHAARRESAGRTGIDPKTPAEAGGSRTRSCRDSLEGAEMEGLAGDEAAKPAGGAEIGLVDSPVLEGEPRPAIALRDAEAGH